MFSVYIILEDWRSKGKATQKTVLAKRIILEPVWLPQIFSQDQSSILLDLQKIL